MRPRIRVAVLTAALITPGILAAPAAAETPRVEVVVDGLNNPRGIDVGPDGTVYVAEGGTGGDEHCITIEFDGDEVEACMGTTAGVTAIAPDGTVSEVVTGLPSLGMGEDEFIGAADVAAADDGSLYVALGFGDASPLRDEIAEAWAPAAMFGTVQHADDGALTEVADLAAWETENDPDADQPSTQGPQGQPSDHSNPNGLLLTDDGALIVVDAGGNTVLEVDRGSGEIELRALLEDRFVAAPPFLGLPEGTEIPMQSVPTNAALTPDGEIAVSQLTGFPFPVGGARVHVIGDDADDEVAVLEDGFTNAMDLTWVGDDLYVVELSHQSLLGGIEGALVRVRPDGTRISLLRGDLLAPAGVAAGDDGRLYLTNHSLGVPGSGSVIAFDPSKAVDPAIQSACPPLVVGGSALTDIANTTHEEAITCAAWHGLVAGFGDGTYAPAASITRGQLASTVAGLVRATDTSLPTADDDPFTDVAGTTHAAAITDLAAAGIVTGFGDDTFRPRQPVTRAQAVSILVAAYEYASRTDVAAGPDAFDDDDGSVHEANIDAAAAMGWVVGTAPRAFSPQAEIQRGQMASALARVASDLVDAGNLELPS